MICMACLTTAYHQCPSTWTAIAARWISSWRMTMMGRVERIFIALTCVYRHNISHQVKYFLHRHKTWKHHTHTAYNNFLLNDNISKSVWNGLATCQPHNDAKTNFSDSSIFLSFSLCRSLLLIRFLFQESCEYITTYGKVVVVWTNTAIRKYRYVFIVASSTCGVCF